MRGLGDEPARRRVALARAPGRAPSPGAARPPRAPSRASAVPEASDSMQPWLGQVPWHGGPLMSTTMWPELGGGAGRAAVELAVDDQAAADPGADGQHHDVGGAPSRRRSGARRARRRWRRCRRRPAARSARDTRPRIGTSVIGRLTALTQSPPARGRSCRGRRGRSRRPPGRASIALAQLGRSSASMQPLRRQPGERRRPAGGRRSPRASTHPDEHLRAAEIDPDRLGVAVGAVGRSERESAGPCASITALMAPGDPERPERPEYNVYRGGSGGRGRGRRAASRSKPRPTGGSPPPEGGEARARGGPGLHGLQSPARLQARPGRSDGGVACRDRFRREARIKRPLRARREADSGAASSSGSRSAPAPGSCSASSSS